MNVLAYFRSIAAKLSRGAELESEMEEELRLHVQLRADDLERSGLDRATVERRARIEFGARGRFQEECREALGGSFVESLIQDLRIGVRMLRKSRGFTIAAVATLALAVGANAIVFGMLNGLVLRPLSVPRPETLWGTEYGADLGFQSYPNYRDLRDRNRSFEDLAAFKFAFAGLDTGHDPDVSTGYSTTGNYFDVLGIRPYLGRFFHSSDEHGPNSAPYLVLSYAYWHSHFADDRSVVGRIVQLDKHPFTIIGVGPPEFRGTLLFISPDFFMPIVNQEQVDGENLLNARGNSKGVFESFGHLKPGVTPAQAVADVNAVGAQLEKAYPKEFSQKNAVLGPVRGLTAFAGAVHAFMAGLMLLAGLILLAACANLGSLFAARTADRTREVALRLALGSSRQRIVRQFLTEALLIAVGGGVVGLGSSILLLNRLSLWQPFPGAPIHAPVKPDASIYFVALLLALVSGFLFGIVPIRQVLSADPYQIVKAGSRVSGGRRVTVRDLLLCVQITICAVLVTSSLVALRGLERSLGANLGFEPRNTLLVALNLSMAGYRGDQALAMEKRVVDAVRGIPGVNKVGLVNNFPPLVYTAAFRANVFREDAADLRPRDAAFAPYRFGTSPDYMEAAGTHLLAGRDFTWHDDRNAPAVAVINREFAQKMFGSVSGALGRHYKLEDGTRVEVVGIVEDGKYMSLTEDSEPAMFLPFLRSPASDFALVVRTSSGTNTMSQVTAAVRSKLREFDAGLPVDTESWSSKLGVVLFPARVATVSLGVLGTIGAMLSITGVFGRAAYSVSKRLKELGIRMALGAQRREVLQTALGRALKLLVFGSGAGLLLGIAASRLLASIVYQATSRDPLVLTGVVLAMALLGLVATWIPAQRALSLDPAALLRDE